MKIKSLRTKLTLAFIVLGFGPLVLMGVLALFVISLTHRHDIATMETQLLGQRRAEINKFIEETYGLFEIRVGYEQTSAISEADQQFLLEKLLGENKFIIEASFVDLGGQETSRRSRLQDATKTDLVDMNLLTKFTTAKTGSRYFGPVYYTLSGPMMTIAAPVVNRNGRVIMVLTGEISLLPLEKTVSSATLGSEGYVYVVDRNGTIFASINRDMIERNVSASPWMQSLLAGKRHDGLSASDQYKGLSGTPVLAAGLPFEKYLGWAIVAEWPKDDAFAVVATIQRQVILFSLLTIVIVALFGWLVGRKILSPLAMLGDGARKLGLGNFDFKLNIQTGDELEALGRLFNTVGDDLKKLEQLKTAQIRAKALAESLKKEKELSHMREEFIGNTSHQLRTPLSITNWNYELLGDTKPNKEQQDLLAELGVGLSQLTAIVEDLITVSRFSVGFKNTVYEPVNLAELIEKILSDKSGLITEKGLRIEKHWDRAMPVIQANPAAIQTLLINLIDNAITYTLKNGVIAITVKPEKNLVHASIADTGIGIPEADQKSIFVQFFRAKNAIEAKNVGTGLGLFICKNIIEGHEGKIWFMSNKKGTTLHVALPIKSKT